MWGNALRRTAVAVVFVVGVGAALGWCVAQGVGKPDDLAMMFVAGMGGMTLGLPVGFVVGEFSDYPHSGVKPWIRSGLWTVAVGAATVLAAAAMTLAHVDPQATVATAIAGVGFLGVAATQGLFAGLGALSSL